jgi:hypothetical protein
METKEVKTYFQSERPTMKIIQITIGSDTLSASLLDNQTADAIWEALPFDFLSIPGATKFISASLSFIDREGGQEVVEVGDWLIGLPDMLSAFFLEKRPLPPTNALAPPSVYCVLENRRRPAVLRTVKGSMIHVKKSET